MRSADSASNLASLIDFSERTNKVPVFDPGKVETQSASAKSNIGEIKLNFDESK